MLEGEGRFPIDAATFDALFGSHFSRDGTTEFEVSAGSVELPTLLAGLWNPARDVVGRAAAVYGDSPDVVDASSRR